MARPTDNLEGAIRADLENVFSDTAHQIGLTDAKVDCVTRVRRLFNEGLKFVTDIDQHRNSYFQLTPGNARKAPQRESLELWGKLVKTRERLDEVIGTPSPLTKGEFRAFHDAFDHLKRAAYLILHVMDVRAPKRNVPG